MTSPPDPLPLPHGGGTTWEATLDLGKLANYVESCKETGLSTTEQGMRLQRLATWLLAHIPGFVVQSSNDWSASGSQEIDLIIWNEQVPGGFPSFGDTVFVECKNTVDPVTARDVAWFDWKMRLANASHGILVTRSGITGDPQSRTAANDIVSLANSEGRRIMVIELSQIEALTSSAEVRQLLVEAVMRTVTRS
ncbi:restriction endonuclease [Nocardioides islandensis]|uniref:Restriction endonuclease n=1 Tax=Nocardioides islandensis TaxID=433663 RepID=A0A930VBB2_9ACTN|nr:restriction endonuclease [Nocardioides islandensis]MBF4763382.1 restriction endonuclease [Nocardioides islandensis]